MRNEYHHLYATTKWRKIRAYHLQSEPLCRMCLADGHKTVATVCDHILPHKGNLDAFYGGPFQSLCKLHHDSTKARMEHGKLIGGDEAGHPLDVKHHWNR